MYKLTILIISVSAISCSNQSSINNEVASTLQKTLSDANNLLDKNTNLILQNLHEKTLDIRTSDRAQKWFPLAKNISDLSSSHMAKLEDLKEKKTITKQDADSLLQTLITFKQSILKTNDELNRNFSGFLEFDEKEMDKDFYNKYFKGSSKPAADALLTGLQNQLKIFVNESVTYCYYQTIPIKHEFQGYYPVVFQNSTRFAKGETIEVTTGIAVFSRAAMPQISINNNSIPINEVGYSSYKQKVRNDSGTYSFPVKISFYDQDGKQQWIEKQVKYTVAKDCDQ